RTWPRDLALSRTQALMAAMRSSRPMKSIWSARIPNSRLRSEFGWDMDGSGLPALAEFPGRKWPDRRPILSGSRPTRQHEVGTARVGCGGGGWGVRGGGAGGRRGGPASAPPAGRAAPPPPPPPPAPPPPRRGGGGRGRPAGETMTHRGSVTALAFNPDGR